ncbi:MAG: hypothetical protein ABI137_10545 [Antricoccus sp.]
MPAVLRRSASQSYVALWIAAAFVFVTIVATVEWSGNRVLLTKLNLISPGADPAAATDQFIGAIAAAALLGIAVSLLSRMDRLSWVSVQCISGTVALLWTLAMSVARGAGLGALSTPRDQTYVAQHWITFLQRLDAAGSAWYLIAVAVLCAIAVVVLNAGVQSLCGAAQAKRFALVAAMAPCAAWYSEGATSLSVLLICATIGLAAMASERGRGLGWSTSLGVVAGLLLAVASMVSYDNAVVGIGILIIFFLRRRSLMILVAGAGLGVGLLVALILGWSWSRQLSGATQIEQLAIGDYFAFAVAAIVFSFVLGGPLFVASWRKARISASWPLILTGLCGVLFVLIARTFTTSFISASAGWLLILSAGCTAPESGGARPTGPTKLLLALTGGWAIVFTVVLAR